MLYPNSRLICRVAPCFHSSTNRLSYLWWLGQSASYHGEGTVEMLRTGSPREILRQSRRPHSDSGGRRSGRATRIVSNVFFERRVVHFTEYLVNAPPACTREFGPSAA